MFTIDALRCCPRMSVICNRRLRQTAYCPIFTQSRSRSSPKAVPTCKTKTETKLKLFRSWRCLHLPKTEPHARFSFVTNGRSFVLLLMFFSPLDLRAPSGDRPETLPGDRYRVLFYNLGPKIWGSPPKNSGAKNVQNSARFRTTSDFDREYLRNGWIYRKSEN